ncbi:MAG TPA: hypothetical protein VJL89_04305, partial [Thermodesulfovibrionia bacterium]|nr:hypothetical protein [Thermodesulfovibrionia bacterium]
MTEANITFGKIVSFPKPLSWSQVYNAGKLFAVLSLKKGEAKEQEASDFLNQLGKGLLDKLEEEFFTIETKNLSAIKQAAQITLQNLPDDVISSIALAVFSHNILYLFA